MIILPVNSVMSKQMFSLMIIINNALGSKREEVNLKNVLNI